MHCYPSYRVFTQLMVFSKKVIILSLLLPRVSSKPEGFEVNIFEEAIAEVYAFNALVKAKKELKGVYATGRQNVMDPLHQFNFSESNGNSFINGVLLDDYFRKHTIAQAYITATKILPDIIRGLIYLYNAGIIHYDLHQRIIIDTLLVYDNENVMTLAQHDHTTADIAV
ncbi:hypothetical protein BDF22DRAFT_657878 [Syncephalis plumigaleata]|nr:hypothetical protein BDF22DRAFT_657878 [Syncephalis plumigaleata]